MGPLKPARGSGELCKIPVGDVDRINPNKGIPTIKGDGVSSTT